MIDWHALAISLLMALGTGLWYLFKRQDARVTRLEQQSVTAVQFTGAVNSLRDEMKADRMEAREAQLAHNEQINQLYQQLLNMRS